MEKYVGTRIGGIDFGMKRIGTAVSDELHVVTRPLHGFLNNENVANEINDLFQKEGVKAIVVGMPKDDNKKYNNFGSDEISKRDKQKKELIQNIFIFSDKLKENGFDIFYADEGFSSQKAKELMIDSGKKMKFRKQKINVDNFAAAIILQEFLEQNI